MGLKKMIRGLIPPETLHILKQEKCISRYVDNVYNTLCSNCRKNNKEDNAFAIKRIKQTMRECSFFFTFNALATPEGYHYWLSISNKIRNYIEECR